MKLFLIDGHALIFKMYYAFLGRPMMNTKGEDTSILFGFTKYLLELIVREKPSHLAVAFDPPGGTFRNKLYPEYKANRSETPQLVIDALEPLTQIIKTLDIPVLMIPGYEADDVIGSMALRSAAQGFEVYMVTHDKDYGQLVGPGVYQYRPGKAGENEILGPAEICEKWGISHTRQVIDILTLCGDSADNVPGVPGVGPVGAAKLLAKYGDVDGIYAHLDELSAKQKEKFDAASSYIGLSRELVTIKTDIELDTTADDMILNAAMTPAVSAVFDRYEFPSLKKKVSAGSGVPASGAAGAAAARPAAVKQAPEAPAANLRDDLQAIYYDSASRTVTLTDGKSTRSGSVEDFKAFFEDETLPKCSFAAKDLVKSLTGAGIELRGELLDVELMHYLLNPERGHSLPELAMSYLGTELATPQLSAPASLFDDIPSESIDRSAEAGAILQLGARLYADIESAGMLSLYNEIEMPLLKVLARMELSGVRIDTLSLRDFADSLRRRMTETEKKVRELAGEPALNVSSPKQIGTVIFEKLALDPQAKKPKSGNWPTDEQTLSELADRSPIIGAILDYRGVRKLLSTYIEPLPSYVSAVDGRVHTTFNQTLTSTGRLSSSNPNLQNIPVRTEDGREIRKAFVPSREGWVMMSADYSQIELRLMAHFSGDAHMQQAFRDGVDVHRATAAKIFGKSVEQVSDSDRRVAKTANFGIMYGISAFGLAQRLGCPRGEAKQIIEDYFASFPTIREYIDKTLRSAREKEYVETLFGRRRYVPDVNAHNAQVRSFAERNAVNAPIQGTAADIIKLAMIAVDRRLAEEGRASKLVLQIHDELLLEVPQDEIDAVQKLLVEEMENVVELSVPLTVECNYGKTWLEAH